MRSNLCYRARRGLAERSVRGRGITRIAQRLGAFVFVFAPLGFAPNAVVVKQYPAAGVAAGKHMRVKLLLRATVG